MLHHYLEGKFAFDTKMTIGVEIFHKTVTLKNGHTCSLQCDLTEKIEVNDESTNGFMEFYKITCFYKGSSKTGYNINEAFIKL